MISVYGKLNHRLIPEVVERYANEVQYENCNSTHHKDYSKHTLTSLKHYNEMEELIKITVDEIRPLDWVYFSAANGAEPHKDLLDPEKFDDITYVIPLVLPKYGKATLVHGTAKINLELYKVYGFDHTLIHSLEVSGNDTGCTLIMAAALIQ